MESTLVIFDFDCTLVEVDSDPWVAEQFDAASVMEDLRSRLPWNAMMDGLMEALHGRGIGLSDVEEALRRIPLQPEKICAIKNAHALGCELRIVSDANSFFIKTILDKYGVTSLFTEIHTNPACADGYGRLHIGPFHPLHETPHGCPLCPPNMCKGTIIDQVRAQSTPQSAKRIIYIGDGIGDYCPSLRLQARDCILPREGYPLLELLTRNASTVKASVYPWGSAKIMEEKLQALLESQNLSNEEHDLDTVACTKCALPLVEQAKEGVPIKTVVYA